MQEHAMVDLSDTDIRLEFAFEGDVVLQGTINRIHGPLIVEDITARLPIEARAAYLNGEMKITLDISRGNAKPTSDVKRGDIAYMPLGDSLCIYLKDTHPFSRVNVLGRVTSDDSILDALVSVKRGGRVSIRRADE